MTPTRRAVLAGLSAMLATPARATPPNAVRRALDAAAAAPPADALRLLDGVAATSASERLDLEAAREGLAIEAALTRVSGADRYALSLRRQVGDVAIGRARAIIEREHVRVSARADRLFRALGMREESIGERYRTLWRDERFLYPDSDAGRDQAIADMNRTLASARAALPRWFGPLSPETSSVAARRMSHDDEARRRGGYREVPSPAAPGGYFVDLHDIRRRPSWTLPSVVHHELLPGHMVQLPIEAAAAPHPLRLRYAPAFAEGWAIYAEQLAADHRSDPRGELGRLHWLLFRLCRARADLGIHLDGWSVAQTRAKLEEWQGEPAYFAPFDTDLPRIAADPATRAAEAVTWLAIADLARGRRGARLVRFHQEVLAHGRKRLGALIRAAGRP